MSSSSEKNRLEHLKSRLNSVLLRKNHSLRSLNADNVYRPRVDIGWKEFRAKCAMQRSFNHYKDLSSFRRNSLSSPLKLGSTSRNSSIESGGKWLTLEQSIGLFSLKKTGELLRTYTPENWAALSPEYRKELVSFCNLITKKERQYK